METTVRAAIEKPEGMLRSISFPTLMLMDTATGDGRKFLSSGKGTRDLPLTLYAQFTQAPGHDGAVVAGSLYEVSFDDETGNVSGRAWLLDDENGRKAAMYIATKALRHNSVDLADVTYTIDWGSDDPDDPAFWELNIVFDTWNIGATTLLGLPAFKDAHATLDDEVTAALASDEELECDVPLVIRTPLDIAHDVQAALAMEERKGIVQPWAAFYQLEPDDPAGQKLTVDENGWVSGHIALWDTCHDGIEGRCVVAPRPSDGYASFNKPGVLTDKGMVATGPITLLGGHPRNMAEMARLVAESCGDVENAWADVRVTDGRYGPWASGIVRPNQSEEQIYAARASRISGWWSSGRLKGICSVLMEGFDVGRDVAASFYGKVGDDGEIVELIASLPHCKALSEAPVEEQAVEEPPDEVEEGPSEEDLALALALELELEAEAEPD